MDLHEKWHKDAEDALVGRRITAVRWMYQAEVTGLCWGNTAIMLYLDDGSVIVPWTDDEGNDAGALWQVGKGHFEDDGEWNAGIEHVWPVGVKGGE